MTANFLKYPVPFSESLQYCGQDSLSFSSTSKSSLDFSPVQSVPTINPKFNVILFSHFLCKFLVFFPLFTFFALHVHPQSVRLSFSCLGLPDSVFLFEWVGLVCLSKVPIIVIIVRLSR